MNRRLFFYEMKKSVRSLLIFAAILSMYVLCIIWMFDPKMMESLNQMYEMMPQIMSAVGMKASATTLNGFMVTYLYGFIMPVFPMVFVILRAKSLIAEKVEKKTMASLLAAPVKRRTIVATQIGALLTGLVLLIVYTTAMEIVFAQALYPGELDVAGLVRLNVGIGALHFFMGGICMLTSAFFHDTGWAVGVSGGICIVMYLIQMIRNTGISDEMDKLKYATFFTLFDANGLLEGKASAYWGVWLLVAAGSLLYLLSGLAFTRRDLPL